jgi:hypothetical protein
MAYHMTVFVRIEFAVKEHEKKKRKSKMYVWMKFAPHVLPQGRTKNCEFLKHFTLNNLINLLVISVTN